MSFTHKITIGWSEGNLAPVTEVVQRTADAEVNLSKDVAANQTNQAEGFNFKVANLKSAFLLADQDCTVKVNSTSAPTATISLKANEPVVYYSGSSLTNPFGVSDVTTLYVTTGAGAPGPTHLDVRVAADP